MPAKVSSTTRLFADDSLMYKRVKSQQDTNILQEDLSKLQQWEADWQMQFNASKCETICITRKRNPIKTDYYIHGQKLATVPSRRYLGATLNEKLLWNEHVDTVTKKANNTLAFLRRNITSCPLDVNAQCYKTLVRPNMEYAAAIWDPTTVQTSTNWKRSRGGQHDLSLGTTTEQAVGGWCVCLPSPSGLAHSASTFHAFIF